MPAKPTGRVTRTLTDTFDLTLTRAFPAPIDDVWASLTDPARTASWFGPWRGEARTGRDIDVQMAFEEGAPWMVMRLDVCEAPSRLALSATDESGEWMLDLTLSEPGGVTRLDFVQHRVDPATIDSTGPGWEFYLDKLVAAREGGQHPEFDDYYPAQKAYYTEQVAGAS